MQRHQSRGLHLSRRIGDPVLDSLMSRKLLAEGLALQRALAQHVEGAACLAEPAHAVVDSARPEPRLRNEKALSAFADQVVLGHPPVLLQHSPLPLTEPPIL